MISIIFGVFIVVGIIYFILTDRTNQLVNIIITSPQETFSLIIKIFPLMALWLGIMNIASCSGLLKKLSYLLIPFFKKIFPDVPTDHEAFDYISTNFITNMFGLGNASTPLGIKAMKSLQELNKKKDTASESMITFLVMNTAGFTLIPTTILSLRMNYNSVDPNRIIPLSLIASFFSLLLGLLINYILRKWYK